MSIEGPVLPNQTFQAVLRVLQGSPNPPEPPTAPVTLECVHTLSGCEMKMRLEHMYIYVCMCTPPAFWGSAVFPSQILFQIFPHIFFAIEIGG